MPSTVRLEIFLHGSEKYINSVTGDTLFQYKNFSECLQNEKLKFLNWHKIITAFVFMLQEMKDIAESK